VVLRYKDRVLFVLENKFSNENYILRWYSEILRPLGEDFFYFIPGYFTCE